MAGGPVSPVARTTDGLAQVDGATAAGRFHGAILKATTAAEVEIRDGSATGTIIGVLSVAAAGVDETPFSERGIATAGGVWVEVVSGTITTVTSFIS